MTTNERESDQRGLAPKLITVLEAVAAAPEGIGVREIARDSGLDKSTVSRIFTRLVDLGVVAQSPLTERFMVGHRLAALGEMLHTHTSLWGIAEPEVRELATRFDETCYFVHREGEIARFQERVDCQQAIRYVLEPGQTSPLYLGAAGRAILFGLPSDEAHAYIDRVDTAAITERSVTDREELHRLVDTDAARGYSISNGERVSGGHGVASPVLRADGYCVASILITCPSPRFEASRMEALGEAVCDAAQKVSYALGYRR